MRSRSIIVSTMVLSTPSIGAWSISTVRGCYIGYCKYLTEFINLLGNLKVLPTTLHCAPRDV